MKMLARIQFPLLNFTNFELYIVDFLKLGLFECQNKSLVLGIFWALSIPFKVGDTFCKTLLNWQEFFDSLF